MGNCAVSPGASPTVQSSFHGVSLDFWLFSASTPVFKEFQTPFTPWPHVRWCEIVAAERSALSSLQTRCRWVLVSTTQLSVKKTVQVDAQDAQKQLTGQSCTFDGATGTLAVVMGSPFQLAVPRAQ